MYIIKDYPNYRITKEGKIFTCLEGRGHNSHPTTNWKELKQVLDKKTGYLLVTLINEKGRKNKRIHRLLMETFIPNPDPAIYKHINHKDTNKLNNSLDNLEWCTPKENSQHALKNGLYDPVFEKLSVAICQYDKEGNFINEFPSIHEAGRSTNIAWQNISKVVRGIRPYAGGFHWKYKKGSETIS